MTPSIGISFQFLFISEFSLSFFSKFWSAQPKMQVSNSLNRNLFLETTHDLWSSCAHLQAWFCTAWRRYCRREVEISDARAMLELPALHRATPARQIRHLTFFKDILISYDVKYRCQALKFIGQGMLREDFSVEVVFETLALVKIWRFGAKL